MMTILLKKSDRLNRSKAELRLLEEEALNRRANQYDAQIQNIKFRKNLDSFRKVKIIIRLPTT